MVGVGADSRDAQVGAEPHRRPAEDRDDAVERPELPGPRELRPGVHGAATRGDLSINGQLGRNIDYVVDGVSNKVIEWGDASKTGLSLDVVQEFQVITSQFSAEFGHALGGDRVGGHQERHQRVPRHRLHLRSAWRARRGERPHRHAGAVQPAAVRRASCPARSSRTARTSSAASRARTRIQSSWSPRRSSRARSRRRSNRNQGFAKVTRSARRQSQRAAALQLRRQRRVHRRLRRPRAARRRHQEQARELGAAGDGDERAVVDGRSTRRGSRYSRFVNESTNLATRPRSDLHRPRHLRREQRVSPRTSVENRMQFNDKLSRDFGAHRTFVGVDMSRIAKTGVFNAERGRRLHLHRRHAVPVRRRATRRPTRRGSTQGFTDPRRPISLHRDFAPFDFAGIDRSYLERRPVRPGRLAKCGAAHAEPRRALREADLVARTTTTSCRAPALPGT